MEFVTGAVLAFAAGINAYIPMLGLALLAKFTNIIALPQQWEWLTSTPMLITVTVLFLIELLVDKIPGLDSFNDLLQTLIRPASGGLVFTAGFSSQTVPVNNPDGLVNIQVWLTLLLGVIFALIPHFLKSITRPIINLFSAGLGTFFISIFEDISAAIITLLAFFAPILAFFFLMLLMFLAIKKIKTARSKKADRAVSTIQ